MNWSTNPEGTKIVSQDGTASMTFRVLSRDCMQVVMGGLYKPPNLIVSKHEAEELYQQHIKAGWNAA